MQKLRSEYSRILSTESAKDEEPKAASNAPLNSPAAKIDIPELSDLSDSSDSESDDEDWAYPEGKTLGIKRKKPPMIDLEKLGSSSQRTFNTQEEELRFEFSEAGKWIGILITIEDVKKFIWSYKEEHDENAMLFADVYDRDRQKAIKHPHTLKAREDLMSLKNVSHIL